MPSAKLGLMVREKGFFFDAHRAINDCLALLWLLFITPEAFSELLGHAREKSYTLKIVGNSFEVKDELKEKFHARFRVRHNGYGEEKNWYLEAISEATLARFQGFLAQKKEQNPRFNVGYELVSTQTAQNRYKP